MEFKKWKNHYIDLVHTKPDYIIPVRLEGDLVAAAQIIKDRAQKFKGIIAEFGSGSGGHLIDRAKIDPEHLYIGFELRFKRVFRTAEKAEEIGLKNLLVVQGTALHFPSLFEKNSLLGAYVNFPDPWSKPRWRKHRLLNEQFLNSLRESLQVGGFFSHKSDHAEYFKETKTVLEGMVGFGIEKVSLDLWNSAYLTDNIPSEFEGLFHSQGLPIHYILTKKLAV